MPGHQTFGSYAQYVVRPEDMWFPLPSNVSFEQAALVLWPFSTAHRVVADRLNVRMAETLIIAGVTGGMGLATAQLARLAGARVLGLTRSRAKAAALMETGIVDEVVTFDELQAAQKRLRDLTDGYGADHAVDYSGNHDVIPTLVGALALGVA
jgi:putative oxidoreductase